MKYVKPVFTSENKKEAIRCLKVWKAAWLSEAENTVRYLGKDLHCLHYYQFPKEMRKVLRTANVLERAFRGIHSRTRPVGVFINVQCANRIMNGVTGLMNKNWRKKPLASISTQLMT